MNRLFAAIVDDDSRAVKKLLQADARLASLTVRRPKLYDASIFHWIYVGDTALHLAAAGYRVEIVRLLLAAGADPNAARNRRKSSPLHYAADGFITGPAWDERKQVETIRCLLQEGADIHLQDMNGATALHRAVRTRCAAAVRCLLQAGSDPTVRNKSGSTAFHLAVQNTGRGGTGAPKAVSAQRQIIREFLCFGVGSNLRNGRGKSVVDCAQSEWIREVLAEALPDIMRWFGWLRRKMERKAPTYTNAAHWAACHFPDAQRGVARRVAEILVEQVGVGLDGLTAMSRFIEDLGMTDLEPVEVVMALEQEFGFTIPDADCEPLSTVAELVQYLHGRVQTNAT